MGNLCTSSIMEFKEQIKLHRSSRGTRYSSLESVSDTCALSLAIDASTTIVSWLRGLFHGRFFFVHSHIPGPDDLDAFG